MQASSKLTGRIFPISQTSYLDLLSSGVSLGFLGLDCEPHFPRTQPDVP